MPNDEPRIEGDEPETPREKVERLGANDRHMRALEREEAARLISERGYAWRCAGRGYPVMEARSLDAWDELTRNG
jgi:hypothetical protein